MLFSPFPIQDLVGTYDVVYLRFSVFKMNVRYELHFESYICIIYEISYISNNPRISGFFRISVRLDRLVSPFEQHHSLQRTVEINHGVALQFTLPFETMHVDYS